MAKSSDTKKIAAPTAVTVGVVSSIAIDQAFINYFNQALSANVNPTIATLGTTIYSGSIGYNITDLQTAITNLVTTNNCTHIVTAGGLVAFNAANGNCARPFLSLVGNVPTPTNVRCYGGVSLESFANNLQRVLYLMTKGYTTANSISLYYNQNSAMQALETAAWTNIINNWAALTGLGAGTCPMVSSPIPAMLNKTNSSSDYATTVGDIKSAAVIISADPFFNRSKNNLVTALNSFVAAKSGNYVCYPLDDYKNANPAPTSGSATVYGPILSYSIKTLAQLTALVINGVIGSTYAGANAVFLKEPLGDPKDL